MHGCGTSWNPKAEVIVVLCAFEHLRERVSMLRYTYIVYRVAPLRDAIWQVSSRNRPPWSERRCCRPATDDAARSNDARFRGKKTLIHYKIHVRLSNTTVTTEIIHSLEFVHLAVFKIENNWEPDRSRPLIKVQRRSILTSYFKCWMDKPKQRLIPSETHHRQNTMEMYHRNHSL